MVETAKTISLKNVLISFNVPRRISFTTATSHKSLIKCSDVAPTTTPVLGHAIGRPSGEGCVKSNGKPAKRTAPIVNMETKTIFLAASPVM